MTKIVKGNWYKCIDDIGTFIKGGYYESIDDGWVCDRNGNCTCHSECFEFAGKVCTEDDVKFIAGHQYTCIEKTGNFFPGIIYSCVEDGCVTDGNGSVCSNRILFNEYKEEKPIFKVGDKIRFKDEPVFEAKVLDFRNGVYLCDYVSFPIKEQNSFELVPEVSDMTFQSDEKWMHECAKEIIKELGVKFSIWDVYRIVRIIKSHIKE